jgi:hypothetical protein
MLQPVSDVASNSQENIAHAAEIIGRSSHRTRIFLAVYTGKRKIKTVPQLMSTTKLPRTRVLDAGKKLADNKIVRQTKVDGVTAYEKIDFFHAHKHRILALAASPKKLEQFPTKRNPLGKVRTVHLRISTARANVALVAIDDIDSFQRVRSVRSNEMTDDRFSEAQFKTGMQRILGETGRFKDWGGESNDLFTTRMRFDGKRRAAAIALKGPATKGKLTPGKMGKNGDQLQRLFEAPADLFLVQYCRQIEQSVISQMRALAVNKSTFSGERIWFGVIDGQDSNRLVKAYPNAFDGRD